MFNVICTPFGLKEIDIFCVKIFDAPKKRKPLDLISVDIYVYLLSLETIHKRADLF